MLIVQGVLPLGVVKQ